MNKKIFTVLIIFLIGSSAIVIAANGAAPILQFPVKCELNKDCWISEYPDDDPTQDRHDYTGGKRTTNSHLGTDIIIKDLNEMNKGVPVLAAASGIVTAVRDGVSDINVKEIGTNTVDKIGCGNAAVINLGNGWTNIYCHMRKGSVTVKNGDKISTGQRLGYVGMSGLAETPHLHFQVQHFKETVDPFTGNSLNTDDNTKSPLWGNNAFIQIKYYPAFIYNIGISDKDPNIMDLQSGKVVPVEINSNTPVIFLWADVFGLDNNDKIQFTIKDSRNTNIIDKSFVLDKSNVRRFFTLKHEGILKKGLYKVTVILHKPAKDFNCAKSIAFKIL